MHDDGSITPLRRKRREEPSEQVIASEERPESNRYGRRNPRKHRRCRCPSILRPWQNTVESFRRHVRDGMNPFPISFFFSLKGGEKRVENFKCWAGS